PGVADRVRVHLRRVRCPLHSRPPIPCNARSGRPAQVLEHGPGGPARSARHCGLDDGNHGRTYLDVFEGGACRCRRRAADDLLKRMRPHAAITATLTVALAPLTLLGLWSFSKGWYWPALFPQEWSSRAWRYVAAPETGIVGALANSVMIALIVTVL